MRLNLILETTGRDGGAKFILFNSDPKESGDCSHSGKYERQNILDPAQKYH
jgi:hypothetical protein